MKLADRRKKQPKYVRSVKKYSHLWYHLTISIVIFQLLSRVRLCWPYGLQHPWLPCPSPSLRACSNSCPLSWWCHPTVSSSVVPSPPAFNLSQQQGLFQSQLFASGGRSIGVSDSASVLPMNIQDWFPLGLTSLTSLQSKGLSRVFSSTTVQTHQFFGTQPSLWSNSQICTWLLEKP